jgi:hypothetical protein
VEFLDEAAKKRHEEATRLLKEKTVSILDVQKTVEGITIEMGESTILIGELAEQYAQLSLSGSFSGQVKKSVKLLETHLEAIRNKSDPETIKQIEASLKQLKAKLEVLERAAVANKKKISMPTLDDPGQKIDIIKDFLSL